MSDSDLSRTADIVEALLLVTDKPITAARITSVVPDLKPEEVPLIIDQLNQAYLETGRTFRVRELSGGYRLYTQPEYQQYIEALATTTRESRLSQAALETLAVVAYRQPVSRSDVEYVRGCDCDGVMRTLLSRKLVTIKGRSDSPGRPLLYGTTDRFLEYFGLARITDLPDWSEIAALVEEVTPQVKLTLVKGPEGEDAAVPDPDAETDEAPALAEPVAGMIEAPEKLAELAEVVLATDEYAATELPVGDET